MSDFVLLDVALSTSSPLERQPARLPVLPLPSQESLPESAKQKDYVLRRLDLWTDKAEFGNFADTSTNLSLNQQKGFRIKLLLIFALQLLLVWAAVGAATFYPPVRDRVTPLFADSNPKLLIACAVAVVILLLVLYVVRNRSSLNLLVLLLFSAAQAGTFTGLGVAFETNLGFFNCGATFTWVILLALLSAFHLRDKEDVDAVAPRRYLMSPLAAGALAYVLVAFASCVLFAVYGTRFVTGSGFGLSLLFQLAILAWFAWDAGNMFEVMAVNEFSHGVIYLYTDAVLTVVFCIALGAAVVGFTALMVLLIASAGGGGGDCDCDCDCGCKCDCDCDCDCLTITRCFFESCNAFLDATNSGGSSGRCCDCDCRRHESYKPARRARTTTSSTARTAGAQSDRSYQEGKDVPELNEVMERV